MMACPSACNVLLAVHAEVVHPTCWHGMIAHLGRLGAAAAPHDDGRPCRRSHAALLEASMPLKQAADGVPTWRCRPLTRGGGEGER